jgi:hypothetical protein
MDSMKTKFYKRLVPIALIASMAMTNVGITSASAQEITASYGQTVELENVGEIATISKGVLSTKISWISVAANKTLLPDANNKCNLQLTIADGGTEKTMAEVKANDAEIYRITNAAGDTLISGVTVTGIVADSKSLVLTVEPSALESGDITAYLTVSRKTCTNPGDDEPEYEYDWYTINTPFTIKKQSSSNNEEDEVEAGDYFTVPGGLKGENASYVLGIKKVVADSTSKLGDNEVKVGDVNESQLGEWEDDAEAGDYVLYYNPDKEDEETEEAAGPAKRVFIKTLTADEAANLPYTWITKDDLTAEDADEELTDGLAERIAAAVQTDLGVTESTPSTVEDGYLNSDSTDPAVAAKDKVTAHKITINGKDVTQPGQIDLPAIKAVAKSKTLVQLYLAAKDDDAKAETVVGKLIEAFNSGKDPDKKFLTEKKSDSLKYVTMSEGESPKVTGFTTDGIVALCIELLKDVEGYLKDDAHYQEVKERVIAEYLNYLNNDIYEHGEHDLTQVVWALETEVATSKNAKGKLVYPAVSGSAKFWGNLPTDKAGKAARAVSQVKGATTLVTNTVAKKKFNAEVVVKLVSSDYKIPSAKNKVTKEGVSSAAGTVITDQSFYVVPAPSTKFKDGASMKNATLSGVTFSDDTDGEITNCYNLTIEAGKSAKFPFKLADGVEKDIAYEVSEGSQGFTVVNDKITGVFANDTTFIETPAKANLVEYALNKPNVVKVYSRSNPEVCNYVLVQVTPKVKSVRASATKVAMWPGAVQEVSLGTNPPTQNMAYEVEVADPYVLYNDEACQNAVTNKRPTGNVVYIKTNGEFNADEDTLPKSVDMTVSAGTYEGETFTASGKSLTIKVNGVTAPQDLKSFKTALKSKETVVAEGVEYKVVNVPVGGALNIGYSAAPVAAGTKFNAHVHNLSVDEDENKIVAVQAEGDVIKGVAVGTAKVTVYPGDVEITDSYASPSINYLVNVYEPGSSVIINDPGYVVKGGFLMTAEHAATDCDYAFSVGDHITMDMPTAGDTSEPIIWTCNKPSAIRFENDGSDFVMSLCQTGTFTVKGTTKYTKQKYSFKVKVDPDATAAKTKYAATATLKFFDKNGIEVTQASGTGEDAVDQSLVQVKDKLTCNLFSGQKGYGGDVTFTTSDAKVAAISKTGVITCKSAGKAKITATCGSLKGSYDLVVSPKGLYITKIKVAPGAVKGTAFSVSASVKNFDKKNMKVTWTATSGGKTTDLKIDKLSGKPTLSTAGVYTIGLKITDTSGKIVYLENDEEIGTVNIYDKAIKAINTNYGDADTKKAIAALGAKAKEGAKNGAGYGYVYIPVFALSDDGKTYLTSGYNFGDFDWTSSNHSLAEVVGFGPASAFDLTNKEENDIVKNAANALGVAQIKVGNASKTNLSGIVTIKGICKNSKKSFSVKLNVLTTERNTAALNVPYDPQYVGTAGFNGSEVSVNLANVVAGASTSKIPFVSDTYIHNDKKNAPSGTLSEDQQAMYDAACNVKKANGTFTVGQYVLVKSSNIKEVNKDTAKYVVAPSKVDVADSEESVKAVKITATDAKGAANTTYFLALAQVTYKVTSIHADEVEADENGKGAKAEEYPVYAVDKIIVKSISSKTPMIQAAKPADSPTTYGTIPEANIGSAVDLKITDGTSTKNGTVTGAANGTAYKVIEADDTQVGKKYSALNVVPGVTVAGSGDNQITATYSDYIETAAYAYLVKDKGSDKWEVVAKLEIQKKTTV